MDDELIKQYPVPGNDWKPNWTMVPPNAAQLLMISRIESEFASDGPNRGLTWIQAEMLDNHEPGNVVAEGVKIDFFDRWQDVPDGLFATYPSALGFLDDAGLRFYLPAVMRWVLRWGLHWSAPALDGLADIALGRPGVIALLNSSQRSIIDQWDRSQI